ncbi:MAG: IS1182 family transposase [Candidatus Hydrothermia bacterium]
MIEASKFKPYIQNQPMLLPPDIREFIDPRAQMWLVDEYVERMDIGKIAERYSYLGQKAYDPRLMLKLLFYGYMNGITSSRQIARAAISHVKFIYLSGFQRPDFRTINRFRKDNLSELKELLSTFTDMMVREGVITLKRVSVDSTQMKANASSWDARRLSDWEKIKKDIDEEIERYLKECEETDRREDSELGEHDGYSLPEKLRDKARRSKAIDSAVKRVKARLENERGKKVDKDPRFSTTDPDARTIARHGKTILGYNAQIAVEHQSRMIVCARVPHTITDQGELIPNIKGVEETVGRLPDEVLADPGYASGKSFEEAESMGVKAYVKEKPSGRKGRYFKKEAFKYNPDEDSFTCPQGKVLRRSWENQDVVLYKASEKECEKCPMRERCFNTRNHKAMTILTDHHERARQNLRKRMAQDTAKTLYKERGRTVESVIGFIKEVMGIRGFRLRGHDSVECEWAIIALACNMKRLHGIRMLQGQENKGRILAPVNS